ncbi:hypothetical protein EON73_00750 [bacterium]|nr:MAG: hypothetical protein EON73_00750 [bacterium]
MMLRRVLSFVLLVAVLSANFGRLYVFAGFGLNQKYIAATLCENRSKPWLHCDGKCYLMKKVKQVQEREKSEERQTQKSLFQESFLLSSAKFKFHIALLQVILTPYHAVFSTINPASVFRPPQIG